MTYNFLIQSNGSVQLNVDGVYKRTFLSVSLVEVLDADSFDIIDTAGSRHRYEMTLRSFDGNGTVVTTSNVFEIGGVELTGTIENIVMQVAAVFPNEGSGSTTPQLTEDEVTFIRNLKASYETA